MDDQLIFILLAVAFWIFRAFFGKKDNKKKPQKRRPQRPKTAPKKSFQEILEDLSKEAEKKVAPINEKPVQERKPIFAAAPKREKKQENLDWQQVDYSKIKTKKQLLRHEDYHDVHNIMPDVKPIEQVKTITDTEGQVFYFDKDDIDWKKAIITKEILDRKYV